MSKRSTKQKCTLPLKIEKLEKIIKNEFANNPDLIFSTYEKDSKKIAVFFIDYQTDTMKLEESLLAPLLGKDFEWTNQEILNNIPLSTGKTSSSFEHILSRILIGEVVIYIEEEQEFVSYILLTKEKRGLDNAETESIVLGPKLSFTESLFTNLNIVRWRIRSLDLMVEDFSIGTMAPHDVRLIYMKSIANESDVNTMRQRILDLKVDEVEDSTVLQEYIEDSHINMFPQFDSTELPDRFTYQITSGKVGVLVENSPTGFTGPSSLFSFLESTEDIYMRWQSGTLLRLIRFIALFLTITLTPLYVAVTTYQYSIIPMELLISLGESRASVPFPPLLEALVLEFLMELLREAGARLPTKIGQTMGVVGAIVIGQAVVEAGITSNILIIVVATSALASFTSPSFHLSSTIRFIRFPLIILAGFFGMFGLLYGLSFIVIHLLHTTSLGRPYLAPLYPLQLKDFNKAFFVPPTKDRNSRAVVYRPKLLRRFSKRNAAKKRDIDE